MQTSKKIKNFTSIHKSIHEYEYFWNVFEYKYEYFAFLTKVFEYEYKYFQKCIQILVNTNIFCPSYISVNWANI